MHIIYLLLILLNSTGLRAELLKKVEISGNKKTTSQAIIQHGQIKVNQDLTPEGLRSIKERLGRINQIFLKSIDFQDGVLRIEVLDKWTLFPVPMITESGNYYNRGFLLYEDNFLGGLGTLAAGGSRSNSGLNAILYYQDESLFSPVTGAKILMMKKNDYSEFKRMDTFQNAHEARYYLFMLTPNYLYGNQVFKAGPIYIDKSIYDGQGSGIFSDKSFGLFFRHHLNAFQTLEVMYEGLVTTYDLYALINQKDEWTFRHEADAQWSLPINRHFFNLGIHGHHVNLQNYLFPKYLGGEVGFRGYDKAALAASRNIGAYAQFQGHVINQIFLSPFYEFNKTKLIEPIQGGAVLQEHSVGIGIRYYFKKISIPAAAFEIARNINDKSNHFHFTVGVNL